jgi:membrane protease YdiL (CAAX protease family)
VQETATEPSQTTSARTLTWIAALVLASGLPLQLAAAWSRDTAVAVGLVTTGLLLATYGIANSSPKLRPATSALLIFASISVYGWFSTVVTAIPAVGDWLASAPVPVAFLVVNAMKIASVGPAAAVAYRRAWTRDELNLRIGDLTARALGPLRWPVVGPVVIVVVLALAMVGLPLAKLPAMLPWVPLFLLAAVINAASEEFLYRHTAMRAVTDVMGLRPAVVLTSLVFGLAHLTGNPGGWVGVVYATGFGLVCAVAMVQVRGFGWNLLIHIFGDISIVLALTLAVAG